MPTRRGMIGRRSFLSSPTYLEGLLQNNSWDLARIPSAYWGLTNNDKTIARTSASGWATGFAKSYLPTDRRCVYEVTLDGISNGSVVGFSTVDPLSSWQSGYAGQNPNQGGIYWTIGQLGQIFKGTGISSPTVGINQDGEFVPGDTIGVGSDPATGTIKFWRNGLPIYSGAPLFTGLIGKKIMPAASLYGIGDKVTMTTGKDLKYKYPDYTVMGEGLLVPGQGKRKIDFYRKPNLSVLYDSDFMVCYPTGSVPAAGYTTGYIDTPFATNKKSVIEFIVHYTAANTYVGFMFDDSNKSGPRAGALGTLANSAGMTIGGSTRGTFSCQGCTQNYSLTGTQVLSGDVFAFGYDPVAKTIKAWRNGVAIQSGNAIWSNINAAEVSAAYSLGAVRSCCKLNPDGLRYNYGDYTE